MSFRLAVTYQPRGDQESAIAELTRGVREGEPHQVLLGVTGSGKTFTMAKVIEQGRRLARSAVGPLHELQRDPAHRPACREPFALRGVHGLHTPSAISASPYQRRISL